MKEIENSFASNICRCTGYRPIADAFKTFAKDADDKLMHRLCDLEDLYVFKTCGLKCTENCNGKKRCHSKDEEDRNIEEDFTIVTNNSMIVVDSGTHKWYKPYTLDDVFKAMKNGEYKLIAGNTGQGKYVLTKVLTTHISYMFFF